MNEVNTIIWVHNHVVNFFIDYIGDDSLACGPLKLKSMKGMGYLLEDSINDNETALNVSKFVHELMNISLHIMPKIANHLF